MNAQPKQEVSLKMANITPKTATLSLATGNLESYIHAANQIPILSSEEEYNLAKKLHQQGDLVAARHLVMSHLRFVIKIARSYSGYGLSQADLIQEGSIGLMKAIKRFNPDVGVRLVSFAVHWIKAEIHEFILKNWRIVKVATTKAQRKLFFNLRSMKKKSSWLTKTEINDIAETLNVKPSDITTMENRLYANDMIFDMNVNENDSHYNSHANKQLSDNGINPASLIESDNSEHSQKSRLMMALKKLDTRSENIIQRRWLIEDQKATLQQLANEYKVSPERIRQLEQQAMIKIKKLLKNCDW